MSPPPMEKYWQKNLLDDSPGGEEENIDGNTTF